MKARIVRNKYLVVGLAIGLIIAIGAGLVVSMAVTGAGNTKGQAHKVTGQSVTAVKAAPRASSPAPAQAPAQKTGQVASQPAPTAAGEAVAYLQGPPKDDGFVRRGDIYIANLDGSGERQITTSGDVTDFRPSPSGNKIAFLKTRNTGEYDGPPQFVLGVFLMNADGTNLRQLPFEGSSQYCAAPVFDPNEKYLYIARKGDVAKDPQFDSEASYTLVFERYDIDANTVEPVYPRAGMFPETHVSSLCLNPGGTELYFTLVGSQWPGSEVPVLNLGRPATEAPFMAERQGNPGYTGFSLMSFSKNGDYVSYNRDVAEPATDPSQGPILKRYSCLRPVSGGTETVINESEAGHPYAQGAISRLEFSGSDAATYFFSKVTGAGSHSNNDIEFYKGSINNTGQEPTGLHVNCMDAIWHLIKI